MGTPALSVVMAVFNGGRYLSGATESILEQSFRDFEFIIVNDGSTDDTGKILDAYAARDKRISVLHQAHAGVAVSLNRGIGMARAHLVARMDADDISLPNRFEKQIQFLAENPHVAVLGTAIRVIDENETAIRERRCEISPEAIVRVILERNPVWSPTVMMRTHIVREIGGYRPLFEVSQDYDLWLRISEQHRLANLPEVHVLYRKHSQQLSSTRWHHQALSAVIAKLASEARRAGKPDPTPGLVRIDVKSLKLFHLSPKQEAHHLLKTFESAFIAILHGGAPVVPLSVLLEKAGQLAPESCRRLFMASVYIAASRVSLRGGNYRESLLLGGAAFRRSPAIVLSAVFRALAGAGIRGRKSHDE